jgi:predicted nucleic acid-binding protein
VIAAVSRFGGLALLDEVAARRQAASLSLKFTGSLGILRMAKERMVINEVGPIVRRMQAGGIRFGEPLVNRFLFEIGESP